MTVYEKAVALWQETDNIARAELTEARKRFGIAFAYHSGKIENPLVTFEDTKEIFQNDKVSSYTGDLRTLFEISNAKDANEYLLESFEAKRPLDEALIKEFQRRLTQKTYDTRRWQLGERPGEYKRHDYVTGRHEIGAAPEDVPEEMWELIEELQNVPDHKALTAAAYFHAKMENIHPFADGNGRTGRILMNYFLLLHGHPPVIIHEEDRAAYYDALKAWDQQQDLTLLVAFLREQTAKTWKKQVEQVEERQILPNVQS